MGGKKEAKEKPLEKMTAKDLREIALKIPDLSGVHGMNKIELIGVIKASRGIVDDDAKKDASTVREIKKKMRDLMVKREGFLAADDERMAKIYRQRIIRLKKMTRRVV